MENIGYGIQEENIENQLDISKEETELEIQVSPDQLEKTIEVSNENDEESIALSNENTEQEIELIPEFNILKTNNYEELLNKPKINNVELLGNKTLEELGIVDYMTYIDLSTDITNPTDVSQFITKSGTYVAKNAGLIGFNGETIAALEKGMFIEIINLKQLYANFGIELPDSENIIAGRIPSPNGTGHDLYVLQNNRILTGVDINSFNIEEYIPKIDTSVFLNKNSNINSTFGIYMNGNSLSILPASKTYIDAGKNGYLPITCDNIEYAVQTKGANHFGSKTDLANLTTKVNTLETNTNTLISEMEAILDTVVVVNE